MFDVSAHLENLSTDRSIAVEQSGFRRFGFSIFKRLMDISISLALLPVMIVACAGLLVLNPFFNKGPLFFRQERMGRHCLPFTAIKFRTILCTPSVERTHADPIETHRITPLGQLLRRSRLDELPQILNVLKGDMSLIGPRPDYLPHAEEFVRTVPGYKHRHVVRPGISGLAQTEVGYAVGVEQTRRKVIADLHYIRRTGYAMEFWIFWRTIRTVFGRHGC